MLVDELVEAVVKWRTTYALHGVIYLDGNLALLQDNRHQTLIVHEEIGYADGIQQTGKVELAVYHITRVEILHLAILHSFQVELATIQGRDRRYPLHMIGIGTRCQYDGKG